jgi:hypothetical protein
MGSGGRSGTLVASGGAGGGGAIFTNSKKGMGGGFSFSGRNHIIISNVAIMAK